MGALAWHGPYWGDEDDPEDPDTKDKLKQEQEAPSLTGLLSMLETLRLAQNELKNYQKDFGTNYKPAGSPAGFPITSAVMMAEIGLINSSYKSQKPSGQQAQAQEGSQRPKAWDTPSYFEQYGELIEWGVKATALITAGAVMYQAGQRMPTRGYHFRAPSFSPLSANWPLWKIGTDNAKLFLRALQTGKGPEELLEELRRTRHHGWYVGTGTELSEIGWIY